MSRSLLLLLLSLGLLVLVGCGARTATAIGLEGGVENDASITPDAGSLSTTLSDVGLAQDCMPITKNDPVNVLGTVHLENHGAVTVGPITIASGEILDGDAVVATFAVQDPSLGTITPGSVETVKFAKELDSLSPKKGCQTVGCNKKFTIVLVLSGSGIAPGTRARSSALADMLCTD